MLGRGVELFRVWNSQIQTTRVGERGREQVVKKM